MADKDEVKKEEKPKPETKPTNFEEFSKSIKPVKTENPKNN